jgi:hypothetical protein
MEVVMESEVTQMSRTLYRIYLYVVALVMLGFAGFGVSSLLNNLLLRTPLRNPNESVPAGSALTQAVVLAAIALVVALALGGLHYWLIRRDIESDSTAASGAVRAFMLNFSQAVAAIFAYIVGDIVLSTVGRGGYYSSGNASEWSTWIVTTIVFLLLQLERGRTRTAEGSPRTLERLHLYSLQIILLATGVINNWNVAARDTILALAHAVGVTPGPCDVQSSNFYVYGPSGQQTCEFTATLLDGWLTLVWPLALLLLYIWLARYDQPRPLRLLAHSLGFLAGAITAIVGIAIGAHFVLLGILGAEQLSAQLFFYQYDFIPLLILGGVLLWWYRRQLDAQAEASTLGRQGTSLTLQAIGTVALGVPFYIGAVLVLRDLVEQAVNGDVADPGRWAGDLTFLIAGVAYLALAFLLRRNTTETAPVGPRRAVVLAGLAAGALAGAIGLAVGLYYVITNAIGSPLGGNWPVQARYAFVVMAVGAFLTALNLYRLRTDRRPEAPAAPKEPPAPATIEQVLDALLAGRLSRNQAAAALRAMGAR